MDRTDKIYWLKRYLDPEQEICRLTEEIQRLRSSAERITPLMSDVPGGGDGDGNRIERFVEKPDVETAARYVLDGYLWNSGNFIFDAATMRSELEAFEPAVTAAVAEAVAKSKRDLDFLLLDAEAFTDATKISIDYAVMERTQKAVVVAGDFGWSDVGGWAAVWELSEKKENGNAIEGRGYVLDGADNLIRSEEALVAVIGLDDIAVISTRDAVLVTRKAQADNRTP